MPEPITIDIPHKLGRAGARTKLQAGVGQIAGIVPGGSLREHRWEGDTLVAETSQIYPEAELTFGMPVTEKTVIKERFVPVDKDTLKIETVVIDDELEAELEVLMCAPVPIDGATFVDRALCRVRVGESVEHGWSSVLSRR